MSMINERTKLVAQLAATLAMNFPQSQGEWEKREDGPGLAWPDVLVEYANRLLTAAEGEGVGDEKAADMIKMFQATLAERDAQRQIVEKALRDLRRIQGMENSDDSALNGVIEKLEFAFPPRKPTPTPAHGLREAVEACLGTKEKAGLFSLGVKSGIASEEDDKAGMVNAELSRRATSELAKAALASDGKGREDWEVQCKSLRQEIRETLTARGQWVPTDVDNQADLIMAVGTALAALEGRGE